MAGQRYQDPKIQTRTDVDRPFYFIRPYVPVITSDRIERKQKSIPIGFCDETSMREAKARKQQVMATVNAGRFVLQSQIQFGVMAQKFLDARVPQLGSATQDKYRTHIANHILPVFGPLQMCDIDRPTVEAWLSEKAKPHVVTLKGGKTVEREGLGWWARQDLRNILSAIFTYAKIADSRRVRTRAQVSTLGRSASNAESEFRKPKTWPVFLRRSPTPRCVQPRLRA